MKNKNREIEVRFLDIDKQKLIKRLKELGVFDRGEDILKEVIFYDRKLQWQYQGKKMVRLRSTKDGTFLTFKHNEEDSAEGTVEIEFKVSDFEKAKDFLEAIGLVAFRAQEKKRRTFTLNKVIIDIDTWPSVPIYVELEGPSEKDLKETAKLLNLDWKDAVFESPRFVIERQYGIPVSRLRYFTFNKVE